MDQKPITLHTFGVQVDLMGLKVALFICLKYAAMMRREGTVVWDEDLLLQALVWDEDVLIEASQTQSFRYGERVGVRPRAGIARCFWECKFRVLATVVVIPPPLNEVLLGGFRFWVIHVLSQGWTPYSPYTPCPSRF